LGIWPNQLKGAFTVLGVAGGLVGAFDSSFKRAAFSNEAGVGSAAIAHSAVQTNRTNYRRLCFLTRSRLSTPWLFVP